jgi:uncharacterized coiled-coil protein SlyX
MSKFTFPAAFGLCALSLACPALPALAQTDSNVQGEIDRLEMRLNQQEKLIEQQQHTLDVQSEEIGNQKKIINALSGTKGNQRNATAAVSQNAPAPGPAQSPAPEQHRAEALPSGTPLAAPEKNEENEDLRPQVEALADEGGILSPKGSLTFENTMEYTNTTRNLFAFNGVELAQVVLVGGLTATSVRHQIVQETGRLRLGVTDRLEADVHAPFVYRNDNQTINPSSPATTTIDGGNLGDIDAGLAYQLNNGKQGWPFLIGNLRYKANNADGPFDVPYDSNNIAKRLPTGTGFQTVEASVTAIKVSDPAVLFANVGYVYDVPRDIDKDFNTVHVGHVSPGDAVNGLIGMGFAINQDLSFSLGYKHSFVFPTYQKTTLIADGSTSKSSSGSSQVGALTMGVSYALTPATSLNFNIEAGVTNDAPDVHLIFRVPIQLGKVY